MEFKIEFRTKKQEEWFNLTNRNQCFSGGFNNGKSYIGCLKSFILLATFPKYRMVIARQVAKDLRETTMKTFFKICPQEFVQSQNNQEGKTILKNGSEVLWMHLDDYDEQSLRGLEINSVLLDQAEEIAEGIYLVLDSRIGRWEMAEVPASLMNPNWPITPLGRPKLPTYMMPLCNPDTQFHWLYRYYHPDSMERQPNHVMIQAPTEPDLGDPETVRRMLSRDPQWVKKYYMGEWGISDAQIHVINESSLIDPTPELLEAIKEKASCFRVLDHGDTAPTSCLWIACLHGVYIVYREYYYPNGRVSQHRRNISDLSEGEYYSANYADPAIFKMSSKKSGGFWTVADEYLTSDIQEPSLSWIPADNNEMATRNRINELLAYSPGVSHPITKETPAPKLYFIKRTREYPNGCFHVIKETQSQRRAKLGNYNGQDIYSDDREDSIADHAYDCLRYFVAMHGTPKAPVKRIPTKRSFALFDLMKRKREEVRPLSYEY